MPGPLSMPNGRGRASPGMMTANGRREARVGFSGKTARDHASGVWTRRRANKSARAQTNRTPPTYVRKAK